MGGTWSGQEAAIDNTNIQLKVVYLPSRPSVSGLLSDVEKTRWALGRET